MDDDRHREWIALDAVCAWRNIDDNAAVLANDFVFALWLAIDDFFELLDQLGIGEHELVDEHEVPAFDRDALALIAALGCRTSEPAAASAVALASTASATTAAAATIATTVSVTASTAVTTTSSSSRTSGIVSFSSHMYPRKRCSGGNLKMPGTDR
jgi:hypothetical protein